MTNRRERGFALFETLSAAVVIAISIAGMMSLWAYGAKKTSDVHDSNTAREIAKAELERAKAFGYFNLPLGSPNSNGTKGVFVGSFQPASSGKKAAWVSGVPAFFDESGNRTAATSSNARYRLETQITDTNIGSNNSKPYGLGLKAERSVIVTLSRLPGGSVVLRMGTEIVRGGL